MHIFMKKQVLFLGFISVSIFLVSCSRNTSNVTAPTVREEVKDIPKFVTMNEVANLTIGMSYTEVKNILGTPYNILSAQMDGYALYQYKYKQIYVELPTTKRNDVGIEKAEAALEKAIRDFASMKIAEKDLQMVKNQSEASLVFGAVEVLNRAMNLAMAANAGDANLVNTEAEKMEAVQTQDLEKWAHRLFIEGKSNTLYYKKKAK